MKLQDLTGKRFSKLVAQRRVVGSAKTTWLCKCDCGAMVEVNATNLNTGNSKSCGCLVPDVARGWVGTPEYAAFKNARNRCERVAGERFACYGGRGIKFLFKNMDDFIACVGPRPSPHHSLDRIDPDGNYEDGNVRWATKLVQARNKRKSIILTIGSETKHLKEWCEVFSRSYKLAFERMSKGWSAEDALETPPGKSRPNRASARPVDDSQIAEYGPCAKVWGDRDYTVIFIERLGGV